MWGQSSVGSVPMSLCDRLNQIVQEQNISKREFAKRLGISENYLYILTSNSRPGTDKNKHSPMLWPNSSPSSSATTKIGS